MLVVGRCAVCYGMRPAAGHSNVPYPVVIGRLEELSSSWQAGLAVQEWSEVDLADAWSTFGAGRSTFGAGGPVLGRAGPV